MYFYDISWATSPGCAGKHDDIERKIVHRTSQQQVMQASGDKQSNPVPRSDNLCGPDRNIRAVLSYSTLELCMKKARKQMHSIRSTTESNADH